MTSSRDRLLSNETYDDIPLSRYVPALAGMPPAESIVYGIPVDVLGIFQATNYLSIRQHVKAMPKSCYKCPPCVKQENTYSIYAGLTSDSQAEFLRVEEVSDDWNRCCCTPFHPLKLEVRKHIPIPGEHLESESGWAHLRGDILNDWRNWSLPQRQEYMREAYRERPVLFTFVRNDGMRCCGRFPCKCLSMFVCMSCCQDGMHIYPGSLQHDGEVGGGEDGELGRLHPNRAQEGGFLGSVIQPIYGGGITPTLHLHTDPPSDTETTEPFAKIQGPVCFGGWSELFWDSTFQTSQFHSQSRAGDIAVITKRKPRGWGEGLREFFTDADYYTIEFTQNGAATVGQKATVLAAQLLTDYMYFDGNSKKCSSDETFTTCNFFYCSIFGCVIPCSCKLPKHSK
eukprot:gene6269-12693_t